MRDYMTLSSSPTDEPCAQLGSPDYEDKVRDECAAYIVVLKRKFPDPPPECHFSTKSFSHDFGVYHEVVVWFDDAVPESSDYALCCEHHLPDTWDDDAPVDWKKWAATRERLIA